MKILQSTVEKLLYFILLVVFLGMMIEIPFVISIASQLRSQQRTTAKNTQQIENQIQCIGEYFGQTNRQNLLIKNLQQCNINRIQ